MPRYSEERKSAVLQKLLPPHNRSVPDVAREEGISEQTLYNWRKTLRDKGLPVPGNEHKSEQWSAESKFAVVVETATFSETKLSEYCRKKGLYPQQVKGWKHIITLCRMRLGVNSSFCGNLNLVPGEYWVVITDDVVLCLYLKFSITPVFL